MARTPSTTTPRPWRSLAILGAIVVALYSTMAVLDVWKPRLGLDLRGGTSITLSARTSDGSTPTSTAMNQALGIIRDRVNGAGVGEAEIAIQGATNVVVQVPGVDEQELVELVRQTAELQFRPVLTVIDGGAPAPTEPTASPEATPAATADATDGADGTATPEPTTAPRALTSDLLAAGEDASPTASPAATAAPTAQAEQQGPGSQPTDEQMAALVELDCSTLDVSSAPPDESLLTCNQDGTQRFVLGAADVVGTDIADATAGIPQNGVAWEVQLDFTSEGTDKFSESTQALSQQAFPQNAFAIVLDGLVVSYPTVENAIPGGQAVITGQFTQAEASSLANVLKYGSLPLAFDVSEVTTVSPTLGADQLAAGLVAGAIGLALVVVYSLLYYRGLGIVVVASLAVAGAITYAVIVLLGEAIGFALTLAGVAGLIVAIGVTADSFVIFFERLRDEVREGRSIRMAVETGWARARHTIIVSDAVSFLAAFFLWVFSVAGVRGFAFTLGLTTIVDVLVVFLFTHPMVTLLARTRFFGHGHALSGLSPERLGAPRRDGLSGRRAAPVGATGRATGATRRSAAPPRAPTRPEEV